MTSQPPSSPVFERAKQVQIIVEDNKNEELPFTIAVNKQIWKTLSLDEEIIGCLKKMAKNNNKYMTAAEILFWILFFYYNEQKSFLLICIFTNLW